MYRGFQGIWEFRKRSERHGYAAPQESFPKTGACFSDWYSMRKEMQYINSAVIVPRSKRRYTPPIEIGDGRESGTFLKNTMSVPNRPRMIL